MDTYEDLTTVLSVDNLWIFDMSVDNLRIIDWRVGGEFVDI